MFENKYFTLNNKYVKPASQLKNNNAMLVEARDKFLIELKGRNNNVETVVGKDMLMNVRLVWVVPMLKRM